MRSGNYGLADVETLAHEHATQAIPTLEEVFAHEADISVKGKIANALVRLGDPKLEYWNFLVTQATAAASSDTPSAIRSDGLAGTAPEFTSWVKTHNTTEDAVQKQALEDAVAILTLAEASDSRSIPLLRRALLSRNPLSQAYAAMGLAQLNDVRSVPYIIAACRSNPVAAEAIAQWLVYFDDTQAQDAATLYLGKEHAQAVRDARARGQKPFD